MVHPSMLLQAYTPQIHLGDWQIVIFANRRRRRIMVERCHSSQQIYQPADGACHWLRIDTGIRAFRRQMPVLADALENIETVGKADAETIEAVFQALTAVYGTAPEHAQSFEGDGAQLDEMFAGPFLEDRKKLALMALNAVTH